MFAQARSTQTTSRGRFGLLAFLALVLAVAMALVALPARGQFADKYDSNGDLIGEWHWLRDPTLTHYAEFTFNDPPPGDILLWVTALATDGVNGGPDVNAHFEFLVGNPGSGQMGGVFVAKGVTLRNIYPQANPPGYTNQGLISVPRATLAKVSGADGPLFIRVVRESDRDPHVAFRPESFKIISRPGDGPDLLERLLDDPGMHLLLGDGYDGTVIEGWPGRRGGDDGPDGGIVIDGWPGQRGGDDGPDGEIVVERGDGITPPDDGLPPDMHPEEGDRGDEGACFLDRPCIGDVADGFRSTGFSGMEGWYWLRAPTVGQTADYLFETPPEGTALVLDIAVLGQNLVGATPKDALHVNLTLGYPGSGSLGGQIGPVTVQIPRLWQGPEDDIWRGRALVVIPEDMAEAVIPVVGGLFLSFERIDAFEPDVGFSAGSVLLYAAEDISR